jgi:hypothetical protein
VPEPSAIRIVFTITVAVKCVVLVLEAQGKDALLMPEYQELPPEAKSGVFSRRTFWWLNPLLLRGCRFSLLPDDLYTMSPEFAGDSLRLLLQSVWSQCEHIQCLMTSKIHCHSQTNSSAGKQDRRYALIYATITAMKWPVLSAIFPRLCLIGFKFAQPLLIQRAIDFVSEQPGLAGTDRNVGYGLIGSTALVYIGLAVSF